MRHVIFDTETTGLDSREDRIIEIGGVELDNHFPTGRSFHAYISPAGRKVHPDALAIHGISDEFLESKPDFTGVFEELNAFFDGAFLVAHNAGFDIGFLNAEFARLESPAIDPARIVDTLALARRRHPMGPNSLDALCKRYGIDNAHRTKHGALLDAELLAEVYIEMMGGRQAALGLVSSHGETDENAMADGGTAGARAQKLPPLITPAEEAAHATLVEKLGENALWKTLG